MRPPRFRTKRHAFFIRTRRFRLAATGAADSCARCVLCSWEGLDSRLAHKCSRDPGCDLFAREVSEGAAIVLDSAVRVAFLGGVCGARLGAFTIDHFVPHNFDCGEALIEKCIPQNIARWQ